MSDDAKPQIDKFRDLARELGADEDEAAFETTVRGVAHSHATEYIVDLAKRGPGWTIHPINGAGAERFDLFENPRAAYSWLQANGYRQVMDEPMRWIKEP